MISPPEAENGIGESTENSSPQAIIRAAYRQVFGRDVYQDQGEASAERRPTKW